MHLILVFITHTLEYSQKLTKMIVITQRAKANKTGSSVLLHAANYMKPDKIIPDARLARLTTTGIKLSLYCLLFIFKLMRYFKVYA